MSDELAGHLEDAQKEFHVAMAERASGRMENAREHLLSAAERLFLAARLSSGRLKETRLHLAQELLADAEGMIYQMHLSKATTYGKATIRQDKRIAISTGDGERTVPWLVRERPQVTFDDIAGLEEVKEQIRLKLLYPFTHPDLAAHYDIRPGGGLLLYGPPGTGKTLMARAIAGEIQAAFFAIKPSEIMSQWVGVSEQNIAKLFAEAGAYQLSVIFIDELEALAPKRRTSSSTVMVRLVPQLLAELDGFDKRHNPLLVIGATNEPWAIDGAILRPGRLGRLIYIPPPDVLARQRILELNLKDVPLADGVSTETIAARTERFSGADIASLAQRARERVFSEAVHEGVARPIDCADFEAVLLEMTPSIPIQELRHFERFTAESRAGL